MAIAALAACVETSQPLPSPTPNDGPDDCGASAYRALIGQRIDDARDQLARHPSVRVLGPDTATTMEYGPGRMNIALDRQKRIVNVYCG